MARAYTPAKFLEKAAQQSRDEFKNIKGNHLSSFVLTVLYLVGLVCIILNIHPKFIYLTPINLLLSFLIMMYSHPKWDGKIIIFLLISFVTGLAVEIAGVATGAIFGEYTYGEVLGPKIMHTPIIIGLNWMLLVYSTGVVVHMISKVDYHWLVNIVWKSFVGALILLSLDILIEPVAIYYEFWSWGGDGTVPIQNYIAWFVISFTLLLIFNTLFKYLKNKVAFALLVLQFLFFFFLGIDWSF